LKKRTFTVVDSLSVCWVQFAQRLKKGRGKKTPALKKEFEEWGGGDGGKNPFSTVARDWQKSKKKGREQNCL